MVHFPALADVTYGFSHASPGMSRDGLPHSEICGSKPVCGSPQLIAAYHVLHRLLAPRHSPYALSSLTIRTRTVVLLAPSSDSRAPAEITGSLQPKPVARRRQLSNAHCVCVVGKLPLRSIQLSKSLGNIVRFQICRPTRPRGNRPEISTRAGSRPPHAPPRAKDGGEYRARTGDLLVANQALSQLS